MKTDTITIAQIPDHQLGQGLVCNININIPISFLRDWLASQEQITIHDEFHIEVAEALAGPRPESNDPMEWFHWSNKLMAAVRYARADAMLKARKEPLVVDEPKPTADELLYAAAPDLLKALEAIRDGQSQRCLAKAKGESNEN